VGGVLAFLIQLFVRVPNLYGGGAAKGEEKSVGSIAIPLPIAPEAKTWSGTWSSGTTFPMSGLAKSIRWWSS